MSGTSLGLFLVALGCLLIAGNKAGARHATRIYQQMGFEVSAEAYAKKFQTVGLVVLVLGAVLALELV